MSSSVHVIVALLLSFALMLAPRANAQSIECLILENGSTVSLQLHALENYDNCFKLEGYEGFDTVTFFMLGHNDIEQRLRAFRASDTRAGILAASANDADQIHRVLSILPDDGLVFTIDPKGNWQDDKLVYVGVEAIKTPMSNEVYVYIELEN